MPLTSWVEVVHESKFKSASSPTRRFRLSACAFALRSHLGPKDLHEVGVLGWWIMRCISEIPTHRNVEDVGETLGLNPNLIRHTIKRLKDANIVLEGNGLLYITPRGSNLLSHRAAKESCRIMAIETGVDEIVRCFRLSDSINLSSPPIASIELADSDTVFEQAGKLLAVPKNHGDGWSPFRIEWKGRIELHLRIDGPKKWKLATDGLSALDSKICDILTQEDVTKIANAGSTKNPT